MSKTRLIIAAISILAAGAILAARYIPDGGPAGFALLSQEELEQYTGADLAKERSITVNSSNGPKINVSAPNGYTLASPVDFDIQIEPRDGVAVDMASIRIEYKLGPAWVNMTRRIMKYAKIKGARLYARGAELPKGRHALRVSISDAQNRRTRATVAFTVTR